MSGRRDVQRKRRNARRRRTREHVRLARLRRFWIDGLPTEVGPSAFAFMEHTAWDDADEKPTTLALTIRGFYLMTPEQVEAARAEGIEVRTPRPRYVGRASI